MAANYLSSISSLARAGATSRAWEAFVAAGLDEANDINALTLKGRLLKDRARQAAGAERRALFAQSGAAYKQAAKLRPDSYPLINAAAMALFAGDGDSAGIIARDVLTLIDSDPAQGETPYWREATRAEALLLLGRMSEAQASFATAMKLAPEAWEDHASTLRQFATILKETGGDPSWLTPHRPPPSLHFSGILGIAEDDAAAVAAIKAAIDDIAPGFAYGALAAGADIIAAEILVETGAELHVILPAAQDVFRRFSIDPFAAQWSRRFDALIEAATSITICDGGGDICQASIAFADYHAMGMAAEHARLLESRAVAIRIGPEERLVPSDPWLASGRSLVHIPVNATVATPASSVLTKGQLIFLLALADEAGGAEPLGFASLSEALAALPLPNATAALDCRTDGDRSAVNALLKNAAPGSIVASATASMALMTEGRASHIEPLGEMATSYGATAVYSVRLAVAS
jgi:hypothetical protein